MYGEFMGISDRLLFLSKDLNPMEPNSFSKPTSEFQEQQEQQKEISVSLPRIKTSSTPSSTLGELIMNEDDDGDTCTTPTSLDGRIPLALSCPPAPRKPKSKKRKADNCRRILFDFSSEVESLFPSSVVADFGGKIKKARQNETNATNCRML